MKEFLFDINYHDGNTTGVLHVSCGGYQDGSTYYEPCVLQPGNYEHHIFSEKRTTGRSGAGWGEIVLDNSDGSLDYLLDYGLDGRELVRREVKSNGFSTVKLTMEQVVFETARIVIRIRDIQHILSTTPFQSDLFLGNNTYDIDGYEVGVEGLSDLKDKTKPKFYGIVENIPCQIVNTALQIYMVNSLSCIVDKVYVGGFECTPDGTYASLQDMFTNEPQPEHFKYYASNTGTYFRLSTGMANRQVTADCTQRNGAFNSTVAIVMRTVFLLALSSANIVYQSFIAVDTTITGEIGIYRGVGDKSTVADVLDEIGSGASVGYGINSKGNAFIKRKEAPTYGNISTLTIDDAHEVTRIAVDDEGRGVPAYRQVVWYRRNYTVQNTDLVPINLEDPIPVQNAVAEHNRFIKQEWREVKAEDLSVKTKYLISPEVKGENNKTNFINEADALAEATHRLNLNKVRRDYLSVKIKKDDLRYDNEGYWDDESISDLPEPRNQHTSFVHNGYRHVVAGAVNVNVATNTVLSLNLAALTGQWEHIVPDLPEYGRRLHAGIKVGNKYYVLGGEVNGSISNTMRELNLDTMTWSTNLPFLPNFLQSPCVFEYDNKLFLLGGLTNTGINWIKIYYLDLNNIAGGWVLSNIPDLSFGRYGCAVHIYNGYVYVAGGRITGGNWTNSVIRYNIGSMSGVWENMPALSEAKAFFNNDTTDISNKFVLFGGEVTFNDYVNTVESLDLDTLDRWNITEYLSLPQARTQGTVDFFDGNYYLTGGFTGVGVDSPSTYLYRSNSNPEDMTYLWDRMRVIKLVMDRYGYNGGKLFSIMGVAIDDMVDDLTLYLWG